MHRSLDLLLARHGTATYKHGIYNASTQPYDLDERGSQQACAVGMKIKEIMAECTSVNVVSSPITRAMNTAHHICDAIGFSHSRLQIEPGLRCIDKYDDAGFNTVWGQFPNGHDVDRAWIAGDLRFEGNPAFESRSAVYARGAGWLARCFEQFSRGQTPEVIVMVSHAEILNLLVERLDREPIHQCELLHMKLAPASQENTVSVTTHFRDHETREQLELLPPLEFGRQFSKYL